MIYVYNKNDYNSLEDAKKNSALFETSSMIDDDYTSLADIHEVINALRLCTDTNIGVYFSYDGKVFQELSEKIEILTKIY